MANIDKVFKDEQTKKIVNRLTENPTIIKGYTSTLSPPSKTKAKTTKREKRGR